ncbi:MAG: iron complex outermembrane receptor protein [Paracoccaceae bacterium]|jgi:iron complex outermembrane receptor protein
MDSPRVGWVVIGLGFAFFSISSFAQSQDSDDSVYGRVKGKANTAGFDEQHRNLEEVFVTARRREELLQESPVSVSAFTSAQMEEAGIYSIVDLEHSVPNLQFSQSTTKDQVIFIRGMGQRTDVSVFDPSVGVYLNSILVPRHDAALMETVDIQSVQVLRGPQGTLFGKNNTGGAILFSSKLPDLESFSGSLTVRGGGHEQRSGRFSANVPLIEGKLGMRFALNSSQLGGYVENNVDGASFMDEDRRSASMRLLWQASDEVSADLFGFFSRTRELGLGPNCILQNPNASMPKLVFPGQPSYTDACNQSEALARDRKIALNTDESRFEIDSSMLAFTVDWALNDTLSFRSITGLSHWDNIVRSDDADASAAALVSNGALAVQRTFAGSGLKPPEEERWQVTQEFQFTGSALNERLSYTAGIFSSVEQIDDAPFGNLVGKRGIGGVKPSLVTGLVESNGFPAFPPQLNAAGDDTLVIPFVEWLGTASTLRNESVAVFGELSWEATDWMELTLGGRYTSESRARALLNTEVDYDEVGRRIGASYREEFGVFTPISRVQFDALENDTRTLPLINPTVSSLEQRFNEFTPSATAKFRPPERWFDGLGINTFMTYMSLSKGFKAGGFDAKGTELVTVEPERVTNIELGFKLDAADSRFRLNGAFFHTDWQDMQLQVAELGDSITGSEILLYFTNAGQATTSGAELEATLTLAGFLLQANASYLNARYNEFMASAVTPFVGERQVDRSDEDLFISPEVTYGLSAQYHLITPFGLVIPRLSYSYRDEVFTGLDFLATEYETSYADEIKLLNFRLTWLPSEEFRLSLYVNNIRDEFYFASGLTNSDALGAAMMVQGPGRQLGMELNWDF